MTNLLGAINDSTFSNVPDISPRMSIAWHGARAVAFRREHLHLSISNGIGIVATFYNHRAQKYLKGRKLLKVTKSRASSGTVTWWRGSHDSQCTVMAQTRGAASISVRGKISAWLLLVRALGIS